jgi:hypothetical protein
MKNNPTNPNSAPKKEDPTTKKNDELQEGELNKVTGGSTGAGAGKVTFNPPSVK